MIQGTFSGEKIENNLDTDFQDDSRLVQDIFATRHQEIGIFLKKTIEHT